MLTDKRIQTAQGQMELSWESSEWLIRRSLVSIDNIVRLTISEMSTLGVPKEMIADFLPKQFERLKREVVEEGNKQDGKRRIV